MVLRRRSTLQPPCSELQITILAAQYLQTPAVPSRVAAIIVIFTSS